MRMEGQDENRKEQRTRRGTRSAANGHGVHGSLPRGQNAYLTARHQGAAITHIHIGMPGPCHVLQQASQAGDANISTCPEPLESPSRGSTRPKQKAPQGTPGPGDSYSRPCREACFCQRVCVYCLGMQMGDGPPILVLCWNPGGLGRRSDRPRCMSLCVAGVDNS